MMPLSSQAAGKIGCNSRGRKCCDDAGINRLTSASPTRPRWPATIGLLAATGADGREHFPTPAHAGTAAATAVAVATGRLARRSAVRAAGGLVGKALLGVEVLLALGEDEGLTTVATG